MDTAPAETVAAIDDTREAPLGTLSAAPVLRRLKPADTKRVPVAAFNASL